MLPIDKYIGKLLVAGFIAPMMLFASTSPAMAYKKGDKYFVVQNNKTKQTWDWNEPNITNKSGISPGNSYVTRVDAPGSVEHSGSFYVAVADDYTPARSSMYAPDDMKKVNQDYALITISNPERRVWVKKWKSYTKWVGKGKHKKKYTYWKDEGGYQWIDAFNQGTYWTGRAWEYYVSKNRFLSNTQHDDTTKGGGPVQAGYKNLKGIRWKVSANYLGKGRHNLHISPTHITFWKNANPSIDSDGTTHYLYDKINIPFTYTQTAGYRLVGQETSTAAKQNLSRHYFEENPLSAGFSQDYAYEHNNHEYSNVVHDWLSVRDSSGNLVTQSTASGTRKAYINMNARFCVIDWYTGDWQPSRGITQRLVYRVASAQIRFDGNGGTKTDKNNVAQKQMSSGVYPRVDENGGGLGYQLPGYGGKRWKRTGYDHSGWGDRPEGRNTYGLNGLISYPIVTDKLEDPVIKTVYAKWTAHKLKITYADSLIDNGRSSPYADNMRTPKNGGAVMATTTLHYGGIGGEGNGRAFKEYTSVSQSSDNYYTTPLNFWYPGYDSLEQWEQTDGHVKGNNPKRWEYTAQYGTAQALCEWLTNNFTDSYNLGKTSNITINMRAVFAHHPYSVTYDANGGYMGSPSTNGVNYTQSVPFSDSHIVGTYNKNMSTFPPISKYDYTQRNSWSLYVNTPSQPDYSPIGGQNFAPGDSYQGRWLKGASVGMYGKRAGYTNTWYDGWWWVNDGTFRVDWNKNPVVYQKDPSLWVGDPDGTTLKPFIYSYGDAQKAPDRPEANRYIGKIILQKGDKVNLLQFVQGSDQEDGDVTANDYVESIAGYSGQTGGSTIAKLDPAKCTDGDGNFSVTYRTKDNDETNDAPYGVTATSTKSITLNFHINTAPVLTSGSDRYYFSSNKITIEDLKKRLTATDEKEDTNKTTAITYPKPEIEITAIRYPNGSLVSNPSQIDNTQVGDCLVWARITDTMHMSTTIDFPMTITPDYEDVPDQKRIRFISQDFLDTLDEHVDGAAELKEELNKGFENYDKKQTIDSQSIDMTKKIKISELGSKGALNSYQYNRILNSKMKNSTKNYTADTAITYKTYVDLTDASYGEKYQYLWKK